MSQTDERRAEGEREEQRGRQGGLFQALHLPISLTALWLARHDLPEWLLLTKGALDALIVLLWLTGRGQHTRLNVMLSSTTIFALLCLTYNLAGRLITPGTTQALLMIHAVYSAVVVASQVGLLQKRFIADALSFCNLLCGVASMHASSHGEFNTSLLYLLLGAAFDGFDGAAARKFGGTRWGVYSDDVADGVNYGLAPGVALYYLLGGAEAHLEGLIIGAFYGTFTISRLIFFTLNKDESDPNYFAGIPSPVGGMIVMCGVVLFRGQPTWVSFLAGVACAQMVSFSTSYRHLGRAFSRANRTRRVMWGAPMYLGVFLIGALVWGTRGAAAVVLAGALTYGFLPSAMSFVRLIRGPEA
jgi:CDP-diacylglycerol--serine O-phosphatidyltransferase